LRAASPDFLLTLEGSTTTPALKIKDTTNGVTLLAFSQDANSHIGTYSNHPLVFDTNSAEAMRIDSAGKVGIGTVSPSVSLDINDTDAIKVPVGTTAQRPTAANGMLRYSTTDNQFEGYADGAWGAIAGGGGGSSDIERNTFSGNGSTTQFTLTSPITDEVNTQVYVDGVYQSKLNYSSAGNVITFSSALL
jgi:hypothetical protein